MYAYVWSNQSASLLKNYTHSVTCTDIQIQEYLYMYAYVWSNQRASSLKKLYSFYWTSSICIWIWVEQSRCCMRMYVILSIYACMSYQVYLHTYHQGRVSLNAAHTHTHTHTQAQTQVQKYVMSSIYVRMSCQASMCTCHVQHTCISYLPGHLSLNSAKPFASSRSVSCRVCSVYLTLL